MALVRTWSAQTTDNAPADQSTAALQSANLLLGLRDFLTGVTPAVSGGAWTVAQSSNGTTASAADNWSAAADVSWANAGSAHSWIVFTKSSYYPGGDIHLLIDCRGPNVYNWWVEFASSAYSGGTNLDAPTATNSKALNGGAVTQWVKSSLTNCEWHGTRNTAGDFVWLISADGSGRANFSLACFAAAGYPTGDDYAGVFWASYLDSGVGALDNDQFSANARIGNFIWTGVASASTSTHIVRPCYGTTFALTNFDENGHNLTGELPDWRIYLLNTGTSELGDRGYLVDVAYGPAGAAQRTGTPSSTYDRILIGDFFIPFSSKPTF
jgi:hypothetical protein